MRITRIYAAVNGESRFADAEIHMDSAPLFPHLSPARLSRRLRKAARPRGDKRVSRTYRYYLARIGRSATTALCRLTQSVLIPDPI